MVERMTHDSYEYLTRKVLLIKDALAEKISEP
jgi:hypothetical protein